MSIKDVMVLRTHANTTVVFTVLSLLTEILFYEKYFLQRDKDNGR